MILDAIIGLFASLFALLAAGASTVVVSVVNLLAAGIEMVVGVFVTGFSLGRIKREEKDRDSSASNVGDVVTFLFNVLAVTAIAVMPKVINRKITLVAEDGHSLPFAAVIIRTTGSEEHKRTDNAGNLIIPRFATTAITVKDPRYVESTWPKASIERRLIVKRTMLGSGLDSLAGRLLQPAGK